MVLARTLARSVDSQVRQRGFEYFAGRRVALRLCNGQTVEATVSGSARYLVLLRRHREDVLASCTCPYFEDREQICKHIWATILAAEGKQGLQTPGGGPPRRLIPDLNGHGETAAELDSVPGPPFDPGLPPTRRISPPLAPDWRQIFDAIDASQRPAPTTTDDIRYVIDGPATLAGQQLRLEVLSGWKKPDGSWGALRPISLTRQQIAALQDPTDRQILALLAGAAANAEPTRWYYGAPGPAVPARCDVPADAVAVLMPLLCSTGRCRLRTAHGGEAEEPLTWDGGEAWELHLEVDEDAAGALVVEGSLRRGDERLDLTTPAILLRSGVVLHRGGAARLDFGGGFGWLSLLTSARVLRVPARDRDELMDRLLASPQRPRIHLAEALRYEEVAELPRPFLRLRTSTPYDTYPQSLRAALSFVYDLREIPAGAPGRGLYQQERRRFVLRDREAEAAAGTRLFQLGLQALSTPAEGGLLRIAPSRLVPVARTLLAEGWQVELEGKAYRSSSRFKMGVTSGIDWFDLDGEAEFGGETVRLPELLTALRRGESFVSLADGSLGLLPEDWQQRLAPLAGFGKLEDGHLRFRGSQVSLLDALLAAEPEADCDEVFARARERLRGFAGVTPADAPDGFRGELRGYQRAGLGWLHFLRDFGFGGCLADDMGLGKTVQVLALLASRQASGRDARPGPSLVVVPRSLVFNWRSEAARFTPRLRVLDYTGAGRAGGESAFAAYDLVLTTYGTLRRDVAELREVEFDYVVLDEAQAIKNADSQTAKAARLLRSRHRLALTGTPLENHVGELWSLLEFLNPGLLGASTLRRANAALRDPDAAARGFLARAVRPFLLRRTKEQVAPELPPKVEQTLFCTLPPKQRKLYDELRDHYRVTLGARLAERGLARSKVLILEALLRLRQAACHPGLLDPRRADEPSAKLDLVLPQLREVIAEGHKALVFSQFTSFLALLRRHLDREGIPYVYLDGRVKDRRQRVQTFQSDPAFPLFLVSLKAGGLGLNLTAAEYVYLLDPWWNPAVEAQAVDRAHRIGQTRSVFAYRIVASDTVEEKILALQESKRELADAIIQADHRLLARLSGEDLELLLS